MAAHLLPAVLTGIVTLVLYTLVGHAPLMRALGMAVSVSGMTLILHRFGAVLGIVGSLALAFSPAFWSQANGQETSLAILYSVGLLLALSILAFLIWSQRIPEKVLLASIMILGLIFLVLIGAPRSLRVTTLLNIGLIYVLLDLLMTSNPRPDIQPQSVFPSNHVLSLVIILFIGIVNDPLFVLLAPALIVGLHLSKMPIPKWYWVALGLIIGWGIYGTAMQYMVSGWWLVSSETAEATGIRVPFVIADGWREASRWVYLINLVRNQFTDIGILLGIIGLARLARWYPGLGVTTLVAYGTYALFGLVYFGKDSTILLLPLLMIHVIWMTYAIFAFGQWLQKSLAIRNSAQWLATAAFVLLPLALLGRITGVL
ncbi:MAG: glycosylphosphatidylinositol anchor attachment 1 protein [Chloroflexi bacterium]|nr:glycosylphosphatidylinositol anchor attachment 1 protein [Chloroflexota bacterium]MCC6891843.1 hypothetical protein [Anaerolineae bacterium]